MSSPVLAGAAAAFGVALLADVARTWWRSSSPQMRDIADRASRLVLSPIKRADRSGLDASPRERRQLFAVGALVGALVGWLALGPAGALGGATSCAALGWRVSTIRAARYRRAVDEGAGEAARALASALSAGHSIRSSFAVATAELRGPISTEFESIARMLALGEPTATVMVGLRERIESRRIDLIAAAIAMQQRSGGDLAFVLRSIAATIEDGDKLRDEVSAASAQARFTSTIVAAMPVGAIVLGELAAPGLLAKMFSSPVGVGLLLVAACFEVVGLLIVRRMARISL